jgi:hypothetical protein
MNPIRTTPHTGACENCGTDFKRGVPHTANECDAIKRLKRLLAVLEGVKLVRALRQRMAS